MAVLATLLVALIGCGQVPIRGASGDTTSPVSTVMTSTPAATPTSTAAPAPDATPVDTGEASSIPIPAADIPGDLMFDVMNTSSSDVTTPAAPDSLDACFFTHKPVSDAAVFADPLTFH